MKKILLFAVSSCTRSSTIINTSILHILLLLLVLQLFTVVAAFTFTAHTCSTHHAANAKAKARSFNNIIQVRVLNNNNNQQWLCPSSCNNDASMLLFSTTAKNQDEEHEEEEEEQQQQHQQQQQQQRDNDTIRIRIWKALSSGEEMSLKQLGAAVGERRLSDLKDHLSHVEKQARTLKNKSQQWRERRGLDTSTSISSNRKINKLRLLQRRGGKKKNTIYVKLG